jgi:hypothetical protein
MLHRPAFSRVEPAIAPADRSMTVLQYLVAVIALAAALALAVGH